MFITTFTDPQGVEHEDAVFEVSVAIQPGPRYYYFSVVCPVNGVASPISYNYYLSNGNITIQGQSNNTVTLRVYLTNGTGSRTATLTATDNNGNQITDTGSVTVNYEVGGF